MLAILKQVAVETVGKNEEEAEKALQLLEIEPEEVEATLLKEKMSKIRFERRSS